MDSTILLKWYEKNARDLPWRSTNDPYKIWISEIILQQTRVKQGLEYYYSFINSFPNVYVLAEAPLDLVLKHWQGLGYYNRARNLHEAARQIVHIYSGIFPNKYYEIIKLKGIGKYTAGAIASIAFGEKVAVVDGNVYRVVSRFFGIADAIDLSGSYNLFYKKVVEVMGSHEPGQFNQALMELGALVCTSQKPGCENCPLQIGCFAFKNSIQADLPVKSKVQKIRQRHFNYLVIIYNNDILLHQRKLNDIWKGLFEFPLIESSRTLTSAEIFDLPACVKFINKTAILKKESALIKVKLSHQELFIRFFKISLSEKSLLSNEYIWVKENDVLKYAVPACVSKYIENEFC